MLQLYQILLKNNVKINVRDVFKFTTLQCEFIFKPFLLPLNALKKVIRRLIEAQTVLLHLSPSLSRLSSLKHFSRHKVKVNSIIRHTRSVNDKKDKYIHIEKSIAELLGIGLFDDQVLLGLLVLNLLGVLCFIQKQKFKW